MKYLVDGIELIGKDKDSGYKNPLYLIRTQDGKYIQITKLLFDLVMVLKEEKDIPLIARKLSQLEKKKITEKSIDILIEKLSPFGIIVNTDQKERQVVMKQPELLLSLQYRFTLAPQRIVHAMTYFLRAFFWPPLMAVMLGGALGLNIWMFFFHTLSHGIEETIQQPVLLLIIWSIIILAAFFHECGHAAACRYSGGMPGRIGMGLYLIWPAFFTDLTDVYRLDRAGKLRSDFGGIYFNVVFSLLLGIIYFFTHIEFLLLIVLLQNFDILHQLLPFMRLDGYFIVSDIIGIPDLFMRIKPALKSFFLRKKQKEIQDLKPWARWIILLWMSITIPTLGYFFSLLLWNLPYVFVSVWQSALEQSDIIVNNLQNGHYLITFAEIGQIFILLFPLASTVFISIKFGQRIFYMIGDAVYSLAALSKRLFKIRKTAKRKNRNQFIPFSPSNSTIIFQASRVTTS